MKPAIRKKKKPQRAPGLETVARMEQKRESILDAALRLFSEQGYAATPVPDIAAGADVAAGTIYRYFASKEELVNALYRRWKGAFLAALTEGFPVDATPRVQFAHLWKAMTGFATGAPTAFAFLEAHYHAPYLDAESNALAARLQAFAGHFATEATRRGAVKTLPPALVISVVFGIFINVMSDLGKDALAPAETCAWDAIAAR